MIVTVRDIADCLLSTIQEDIDEMFDPPHQFGGWAHNRILDTLYIQNPSTGEVFAIEVRAASAEEIQQASIGRIVKPAEDKK